MAGNDERTLNKLLNIPLHQREGPQKEDFTFTDKEILKNQYGGVRVMIKDDFSSVKDLAHRNTLFERKSGLGKELDNDRLIKNLKKRQEMLHKDYLSKIVNIEQTPKSTKKMAETTKTGFNNFLKNKLLDDMETSKDTSNVDKHVKPIRKEMVNKISRKDVLIYKLLKNLKHDIFSDPRIDPYTLFSKSFQKGVSRSQKKFAQANTTEYDSTRLKVSSYEKEFYKLQKAAYTAYLKGETFDHKIINSDFLTYYLEKSQKKDIFNLKLDTENKDKSHSIETLGKFSPHAPARDLRNNLNGNFSKVLLRPQSEKKIVTETPDKSKLTKFTRPKSKGHVVMTRKEQENRKRREDLNKQMIENRKQELEDDLQCLEKIEHDFMDEIYSKTKLFKKFSNIYLKDPEREFCQKKDLSIQNFRLYDAELAAQNTFSRAFSKGTTYVGGTAKKVDPRNTIISNTIKSKQNTVEDQFTFDLPLGGLKGKEFYDNDAEINRKLKTEELKKKFDRVYLTSNQEEFFKNIKLNIIETVKEQLEKDPNLINIVDQNHQTPLHWASKRGLEELVNFLLSKGADPLVIDITGRTAKDLANINRNDKIIKTLEALENFNRVTKKN